ncbi:MAG: NAD(+) synthase [Clostridia bacterium]|nr:NAD(+) synthase [Clostridia bacterium]
MQDGFLKVAAVTPKIKVADPVYNGTVIREAMTRAAGEGAKVIVFPELCVTGYTCHDLFFQDILLVAAKKELKRIIAASVGMDALVFVGLPFEKHGKLYNVAAAIFEGKLLALIPKISIPNYCEFYEARHFTKGNRKPELIEFDGYEVSFGTDVLLETESLKGLSIAAEICEDLWTACPPSTSHALAGATLIVNLSASNETIGKEQYRRDLVKAASARLFCAYIYASAGDGESTQDVVFSGHNLIAENGVLLTESACFQNETIYADIDYSRLLIERRRTTTFELQGREQYQIIKFEMGKSTCRLERTFNSRPFVPSDERLRLERCNMILNIQSKGLYKRYDKTGLKVAVIGLSGGLDSTLALLVTVRAFDALSLPRKGIIAVTMPCFGTTDRTYQNACQLAKGLSITLREINLKESVLKHFEDIGHDPQNHNVVYENGQARERTQILMDIANEEGGLVIGTGDMSELALGYATYNGDHMSMYAVNVGVPKTLVRHLVKYYAETLDDKALENVLLDILDTPVSPELLPPTNGVISQKTEELVGPYELHDFFLYYMLRFGYSPRKIYRIAQMAFQGEYDNEEILKWLRNFTRRFFSQQFKRSCMPDGPKVGTVALSPRGDLRMPSDAEQRIWMDQIEDLTV